MLVILRHVSTHLLSHPQALLNLRLLTVTYYMIARLRSHGLYNNCLTHRSCIKTHNDRTVWQLQPQQQVVRHLSKPEDISAQRDGLPKSENIQGNYKRNTHIQCCTETILLMI
jgi:hypothetical protein